MPRTKHPRRIRKHLSFTKEEFKLVKMKAAFANKNLSSFIRDSILDKDEQRP